MTPAALFGYTDEAWEWCKNNEANIWKDIVERKHLYTPDQMNTMKYFEDMPAQFLAKRCSRKYRKLGRTANHRTVYKKKQIQLPKH